MAFLPAIIPAITAVGSIASAAIPLFSAFKKPPTAAQPSIRNSSLLSTEDKGPRSGLRQSLINTSPQGLLDTQEGTKSTLLGG
jgi:hypothetical protein